MKIKRINEESYESIKGYLNIMLPLCPSLLDLCFIDYNGKRYMLAIGEETIGIVENDNGMLNPYVYNLNTLDVINYSSEEYEYQIRIDSDIKEVIRSNKLNKNIERLSYMPRIEDFPRDILEYAQWNEKREATAEYKYDVTSRNGLAPSIIYSRYHTPDQVELKELKELLFLYNQKRSLYCISEKKDGYYRPLFNIGKLYIGTYPKLFSSEDIKEKINSLGFEKDIPSSLSTILTGENHELNSIREITSEYQNYIKGH